MHDPRLTPPTTPHPHRLPLWLKLAYTAFMGVLIPVYWASYGPTNFLYFCDIALLLTLVAVWRESALLASIAAVGILIPQVGWCVDYLCGWLGWFPLDLTRYMFDAELPLHLRSLSLFHGWLPFMLLFVVARLGYDRRAWGVWWAISWVAMGVSFALLPAAKDPADPARPYNVNYVFGLDGPQEFMPEVLWFLLMLAAVPLVLAGPAHIFLRRWSAP